MLIPSRHSPLRFHLWPCISVLPWAVFLFQLLALISFLVCEIFLQLNLLDIPFHLVLRRTFPTLYSPEEMAEVHVHPYFTLGLLSVSVTTLGLFFASGMYSEKIAYANRSVSSAVLRFVDHILRYTDTPFSRYVPHANRALRNFNMYLNLRQPPLRSRNPFKFFRNASPSHNSPPSPLRSPTSPRPPSPARPLSKRSPSAVPITPIPPSSNPRGELIFSSRVDRSFRDSYDRYRSAFERRREEKEREAFFTRTYIGKFLATLPWNPLGPWPLPPPSPTEPAGKGDKGSDSGRFGHWTKRSISGSSTSTSRGRLGNTPCGSRKSSPAPSRGKGPYRVGGIESTSSTLLQRTR